MKTYNLNKETIGILKIEFEVTKKDIENVISYLLYFCDEIPTKEKILYYLKLEFYHIGKDNSFSEDYIVDDLNEDLLSSDEWDEIVEKRELEVTKYLIELYPEFC